MKRMLCALTFVASTFVTGLHAQSPSIGTVTNVQTSTNCTATGWISGSGVTCKHANVSCGAAQGVQPLGITYAYRTPSLPLGTIVFFSCCDGTSPIGTNDSDPGSHTIQQYAADYYNDGYQVVQTAWDTEWEDPTSTDTGGNIGYAACRPATFLSYVRNGAGSNPGLWIAGGMCAQGESAGGAGVVYALARYGAGSGSGATRNYLDKLSLISSPPLADIRAGCEVDSGPPLQVTVCPSGQLGCNSNNSPSSWTQAVEYTDPAASSVRDWTGRNSCAGNSITSGSDNNAWKVMSIVDGTIGTFNYPETNMTAWLCSSVASGGSMNNSSPEAQLFFSQFTSSSQYQGLTINGVGSCGNSEDIGPGTPPSNYIGLMYNPNNSSQTVQYGWQAVEYDMALDTLNKCTSHRGY